MVTFLGSLVQLAVGREEHCKQISLACVGSACSDLATLGLSALMVCVLSQSTLLRLQVALQGNCLRRAQGCLKFPGLSCSGSGSRVLHKGRLGWACVFCPSNVRAAQATRCLSSAHSLCRCVLSSPLSQLLGFLGAQRKCHFRCAVCLLCGADLWL